MKKIIQFSTSEKEIIIAISKTGLINAFNKNPENESFFKIKKNNKDEFVKEFIKTIEENQTQNSQENGITAFEEFLDYTMSVMAENACESITMIGE